MGRCSTAKPLPSLAKRSPHSASHAVGQRTHSVSRCNRPRTPAPPVRSVCSRKRTIEQFTGKRRPAGSRPRKPCPAGHLRADRRLNRFSAEWSASAPFRRLFYPCPRLGSNRPFCSWKFSSKQALGPHSNGSRQALTLTDVRALRQPQRAQVPAAHVVSFVLGARRTTSRLATKAGLRHTMGGL